MEAAAPFGGGQVQGVDVHGIWVTRGARICWLEILIGSRGLRTIPSMREGNRSSYLFLKAEMGGFLIPNSESGGYCVHGLDMMHYPSGESCRKVGNQGGGVF